MHAGLPPAVYSSSQQSLEFVLGHGVCLSSDQEIVSRFHVSPRSRHALCKRRCAVCFTAGQSQDPGCTFQLCPRRFNRQLSSQELGKDRVTGRFPIVDLGEQIGAADRGKFGPARVDEPLKEVIADVRDGSSVDPRGGEGWQGRSHCRKQCRQGGDAGQEGRIGFMLVWLFLVPSSGFVSLG